MLDRPRHGRIRLRGKWLHFPLKPFDLAFQLPPGFVLGTLKDLVAKFIKRKSYSNVKESFASVMEKGVGRTICRDFYFPYAEKIWGLPPEKLSDVQAHRRVSANSIGKMFFKVLSAFPGLRLNRTGFFYYPKKGFGQISDSLFDAAKEAGAVFHLGSRLKSISIEKNKAHTVCYVKDGEVFSRQIDYVWSTIPIDCLVESIEPPPQSSIFQALKRIRYRAIILIYIILEQQQFSEYDAHYFPEPEIPITRLSEPKNYNNTQEPDNLTVLCAELPCSPSDPEWHMTDEDLGKIVYNSLESAKIPIKSVVKEVVTRRLHHAYPIYNQDYEVYFDQIDQWLGSIENVITFGRQGLFVHDNIHHALHMAYSAVDCMNGKGFFNREKWQDYRKIFNNYVVED
jgi:protoporphyrinogen oxidase